MKLNNYDCVIVRGVSVFLVLCMCAFTAMGSEPYRVPDDVWQKVRDRYKADHKFEADFVDIWRPYALEEDPGKRPAIGNEDLAALGYVDVTAAPFSADPTGQKDSTEAIRQAVHYGRSYRMAVFFPAGDYLVSDMLHCYQARIISEKPYNKYLLGGSEDGNVVMVGSTKDPAKRARIVLKENSPGFADPAKPKYVVLLQRPNGPNDKGFSPLSRDSGTINYANWFGSIDIVVRKGNPGAIGIRMRGAEGSSIQDVTVDLRESGLTGMQCAAGSGGSHHHITVLGGRIGISTADYLPGMPYDNLQAGTQPGPTLSSVRLFGQSEWALLNNSRGQLVVVGAEIRSAKRGPVIKLLKMATPHDGCLGLIDASIVYDAPDPANTVFEADRSYYCQNVFLKNAASVAPTKLAGVADSWLHLKQLAVALEPKRYGAAQKAEETVWIDRRARGEEYHVPGTLKAPPADLVDQHFWGADAPTFESPGVLNVKTVGAVGDGEADDTAAIQKAIEKSAVVFLPKGTYKIKQTLRLKPNTKLIGVHHKWSILRGVENKAEGRFGGENPDPAANGRAVIETADDPDAETYLASLGILTDSSWAQHDPTPLATYAIKWQAGPKSIVRQIEIGPRRFTNWNLHMVWKKLGHDVKSVRNEMPKWVNLYDAFPGDAQPIKHSAVLVTGNGGGKWYNFWCHGYYPYDNDVRILKIHGTRHRFQIYQLHGQHSHADAIFEISHASNVDVYGTKTECHTRFMDIHDSQKIRIFGMGGAFGPGLNVKGETQPYYWFKNCSDFLVACMGQQINTQKHDSIRVDAGRFPLVSLATANYDPIWDETADGKRVKMDRSLRPILYQQGEPLK
jgi:hypothetical protein